MSFDRQASLNVSTDFIYDLPIQERVLFALKLLDRGYIVRCQMIVVENSTFLILSYLAHTKNPITSKDLCKNDTQYLSYLTLVSFLPYVGVELFQLLCRHIFGGFQQEMRQFVLRILSFRKYPLKICPHSN